MSARSSKLVARGVASRAVVPLWPVRLEVIIGEGEGDHVAGVPTDTDLDRCVVIVASDGSYLPSGTRLTGPVTGIDKLESLIVWARDKRGLLQGDGARVWLVGAAVRQLTGRDAAGDDSDEELGRALTAGPSSSTVAEPPTAAVA